MLVIILAVLFLGITCKIITIGIRITWGIARILLPLFIVVGVIYIGLVYFAVPIIIILGFVVIIGGAVRAILRTHLI